MKQRRNLTVFFAGIGIIFLILDSRLALEGAQTGVDLCIRTVIPSLFPFMVLSMLLTKDIAGTAPWLRRVTQAAGIPESAQPVLIPAFLGGYPVGAKCVHDLYRTGQLTKAQAERLLAFCSNAGPAFLFGMVSGFFPEQRMVWLLWLIHIFSALMTAWVIPPAEANRNIQNTQERRETADFMLSAINAMGMICGWVVLFRIVVTFLKGWFLWMLPQWGMVLLTGILELTNGCCELLQIEHIGVRFMLCSCMLAFGGICVLLQTASVTNGLSLRWYVRGKAIQTVFSLLLSWAVLWKHGWLLLAGIPLTIAILRKTKKSSGNPAVIPV